MAYYSAPHEDLARTAIAIAGSAEDPTYPAANLISEDPAKQAKLTSGTGSYVLTFSAKVAPVAVFLLYHYLDAGLNVEIQGNDTDVWTSPAFSMAITIPPKRLDGPTYQKWTFSPWKLLGTLPDPTGYLYWRLAIHGTNSQNVAIGRLFLASAIHRVTLFYNPNIPEGEEQTYIEQPTELGVETVVVIGGPRRSLSAVVIGTDDDAGSLPIQEAQDFRDLYQSTEIRAHPFPFVPFEGFNDAWPVRFEDNTSPRTHEQGGYQIWSFSVREVSRGLPWP